MERWNDRREYEDYWENHDQEDQDGYEDVQEEEHSLNYNEISADVHEGADYTSVQEKVEYAANHDLDEGDQTDFDTQFGWRSKRRRAARGKFVPPDTRGYPAPKFVRVEDLRGERRNQRRTRPTAPSHDGRGYKSME